MASFIIDSLPLGAEATYDIQPGGMAVFVKPDGTFEEVRPEVEGEFGKITVPTFASMDGEPALRSRMAEWGKFNAITMVRNGETCKSGIVGFVWTNK